MDLMLPPHLLDPSLPVPRDDPPQSQSLSTAHVRQRVCGLRDWRPRSNSGTATRMPDAGPVRTVR
jgi:hypothetical protein